MSAPSISARTALDINRSVIPSGIAPLDEHLGGIAAGRIHLISGGVGAGKTTACLRFLDAGLQAGERAAIVTLDEPSELGAHSAFLGIDLATPVRRGQLVALRFRPAFSRRSAASAYGRVVDDLRAMIDTVAPPARVVIDPLSPFLVDGAPAGAGILALAELLDGLGATALLTAGQMLTPGDDRRLDPLIDRAATIVSLERDSEGAHWLRVLRARSAGAPARAVPFAIESSAPPGEPGGGNLPPARIAPHRPSGRHRLLMASARGVEAPEDALALIANAHDVRIERSLPAVLTATGDETPSGVLITADHEGLAEAREIVQQIAGVPGCPVVVVLIRGQHRSVDRARLLRGGADEALSWEMGAPELLQRLGRALAREHIVEMPGEAVAQATAAPDLPSSAGSKEGAALADALVERPPVEPSAGWAMLVLKPRPRPGAAAAQRPALVEMLEGMVRGIIRSADSDRAVVVDDSVAAYLHDATAGDAEAVAARIRVRWRAGKHGPLRVQIFSNRSNGATAPPATAARRGT